ncbi:MAG TPA: S41 family peptidase [Bryobacteraceae bacterium]|jgi:carboxyl-terminal processing protease|nr:S41 family peptidase [Bryobacteraceae bacterium]
MHQRLKLTIVILSTVLLATLMIGTLLGGNENTQDAYRHFAVYTEVISRIKSDYVEEPDMKSVTLGALNGLLESVDPYASYLSADQYKQYLQNKSAKKAGVGLVLSRRFGYVGVIDSIPGSPADKAGLTTGDVLETIAGVATRDMPLAYAEMLLEGAPGTTIEMTVMRVRRGTDATKVSLIREPLKLPAATAQMKGDGVGVLTVHTMEAEKTGQVASKLAELSRQGAQKLVLDLRNNAYGTPEEGIALANLFLNSGTITYLQGQKVPKQDFTVDPAKAVWKQPLVVVVNRGTASGAEIAANALADNKRAEIVGERTYGDAALRKAITMDDGSAVILSVAKYFNAAGKAIQDNGVTPSVVVAEQESNSDDDETPPTAPAPPPQGEDLQLKTAIEVLVKGKAGAAQTPPQTGASPPPARPNSPLGVPVPRPPK